MVKAPPPTRRNFRIERVIVNFPGQAKPVKVKRVPIHLILPRQMLQEGFQPFRLVINLKIVEAAHPDIIVTKFNPPIEIRMHYTEADLNAARDVGKDLSLGYWEGTTWTKCTVKQIPGRSPAAGGWLVASISGWGDPTLSLGT
jgi:hypothetical protein